MTTTTKCFRSAVIVVVVVVSHNPLSGLINELNFIVRFGKAHSIHVYVLTEITV
jgi:hypothetical protein